MKRRLTVGFVCFAILGISSTVVLANDPLASKFLDGLRALGKPFAPSLTPSNFPQIPTSNFSSDFGAAKKPSESWVLPQQNIQFNAPPKQTFISTGPPPVAPNSTVVSPSSKTNVTPSVPQVSTSKSVPATAPAKTTAAPRSATTTKTTTASPPFKPLPTIPTLPSTNTAKATTASQPFKPLPTIPTVPSTNTTKTTKTPGRAPTVSVPTEQQVRHELQLVQQKEQERQRKAQLAKQKEQERQSKAYLKQMQRQQAYEREQAYRRQQQQQYYQQQPPQQMSAEEYFYATHGGRNALTEAAWRSGAYSW